MQPGSWGLTRNAAIYFHPEGFDTSSPKLMGRHAAGEGFLKGWVRHADVDRLHCYASHREHGESFARMVAGHGWTGPVVWHPWTRPGDLARVGNLFLPGPNLGDQAWIRRRRGQTGGYSLVGITHTTASAGALDNIGDLLTAPVDEGDALICTSEAVRTMVVRTLEDQGLYLAERLGLPAKQPIRLPQLPIIPLGVDCDRFVAVPEQRRSWRSRLGIAAQDVVVLFVGRLSFHAKAHPIAMYKALQAALPALPAGARLHLVEAGWYGNDAIRNAYVAATAEHCPDIVWHALDGRQADVRDGIWHAADIFCSLSDNIQETFGLTPLEAMAAGLPCVVSDWNGYKETVRHGIDGMRIPTWMVTEGLGQDFSDRHAIGLDTYDQYCGSSCQFVAVDIEATTQAFRSLIADADLRRRMGEAGRAHCRERYDWKVVIAAYQDLFAELAGRRAALGETGRGRPGSWPLRPDPFRSFSHYPTHLIGPETILSSVDKVDAAALDLILASGMVTYAQPVLNPRAELLWILEQVGAAGSMTVSRLLPLVDPARLGHHMRALAFLAKYGLIRLSGDHLPTGS